jgi:hypothetical protein
VRVAFGWVHRAAHILGQESVSGPQVRRQLGGLLGAMTRHRQTAGTLDAGVDHFVKVSRSYWPGLFACYDTPEVPRTNNDLEQLFGSHRYHERRASGRKGASPTLVLRGRVRLVAGWATRQGPVSTDDLAGADRFAWRELRQELDHRRQQRTDRRRFRHDPQAYLAALENKLAQHSAKTQENSLNQSGLPP